jgi:hypothetical protein
MWFIGKLLSMIDDLAYTYDSVWITFPPQAGPRNDHQRVPEVVSNSMLVCLMLLDAVAATFGSYKTTSVLTSQAIGGRGV